MKRFLTLLTIAMTCLTLFAATAEAKRLGGGGSFGKQRSTAPQQAQQAPAATPTPMQNATPAKQGNKWMGPLAGIAAGLGLAALFSHFGLGEGMGMLLMIVLGVVAVMFLVSMLRKKQQPAAMQYAGAGAPYSGTQQPVSQPLPGSSAAAPAQSARNIPADFPVDSFLRSAKTSFIRLQAANDRKDLNDIREYTTPEMFAEISMQMQERDDAAQKTDVLAIHTDLLEVANENDLAIASVRFTGQLRENDGAPESIDEIWHVQKDLRDDKSVWLLAGIQQTTLQ
ncbi:MAG: preprotein translocase subunit Tim44 [Gallionellales bacterium GWA2_60_142]|nr:MAG: preprotein translocase subunit Tim44 [Gallionellales bacterium GWA2_60_142]HCI12937.1 transporter [Gallionellaceae bacterium]